MTAQEARKEVDDKLAKTINMEFSKVMTQVKEAIQDLQYETTLEFWLEEQTIDKLNQMGYIVEKLKMTGGLCEEYFKISW